ncbi:type I-B CRISPR-associated protein Cas7/Cst2/DevR [Fusobacterium periodonticum]|uniref:CRISPR-associated autoregulator devr family protein n=3 Tax=Fusobacterium periodonticum TaxID=860 RepID=K1GSF8_9FUSO|nr:type I-B CRISPR-associated protein Cas7/Cst2/DevR [Fusobacterium periodonticum]AVQ24523.1 type I-B CRISPR-associated protein Cas7/Cst2/DevR [Fusobacterium periodonticum]EKA92427.1 CRISPR-associated autoregulator devr family protein [Fusobacterium periodonticum D10]KGE62813.1 CRISPR-associated protein cas7/cst2/devr, subtype I-b/tneap [Fusobacterium periodonticum 2_1_31]
MKKNALTVTIVANMTSNYSEGLGNISSVQKIYRDRNVYAIRSRESLKNAIMVQSGMYEDLETEANGATQKKVDENLNATNCRALEGGYMNTKESTYVRNSSFYLTDAISTESFINETRFHNNLYLATNYANANNLNVQKDAGKVGLMPYQYEYEKSLKVYSLTIDLEKVGKDPNFPDKEADNKEKFERVKSILEAIENLSLVVKGNLDNAEPVFAIGGLSLRKTHYFENVVRVEQGALVLGETLKEKKEDGFNCALLKGDIFTNEAEIIKELQPASMKEFFKSLTEDVKNYYGV